MPAGLGALRQYAGESAQLHSQFNQFEVVAVTQEQAEDTAYRDYHLKVFDRGSTFGIDDGPFDTSTAGEIDQRELAHFGH